MHTFLLLELLRIQVANTHCTHSSGVQIKSLDKQFAENKSKGNIFRHTHSNQQRSTP